MTAKDEKHRTEVNSAYRKRERVNQTYDSDKIFVESGMESVLGNTDLISTLYLHQSPIPNENMPRLSEICRNKIYK